MAENEWVCPKCGAVMPGPGMLCSGSFTDTGHPSNVRPRLREEQSWPALPDDDGRPLPGDIGPLGGGV